MLDLDLAKKFVWLLRADIRESLKKHKDPQSEFEKWWLISGRPDYPYWSALSEAQKLELFEPVGKVMVGKLEQPIPKAMQLVLARRSDVIQKYTQDKILNIPAVTGWFWIIGVKEHALISAVDLENIKQLDRPVMVDQSLDPNPKVDVPSPTVLMSLAWHLLDPSTQGSMNLQISEQRYRYFCWYFVWLTNIFNFQDLISNRWKSWLQQEIPVHPDHPQLGELPRFAIMEHAITQSKDKQNLATPEGIRITRAWSEQALEKGKKWAWLRKKITYLENKLPDEASLGLPPTFITAKSNPSKPREVNKTFGVNLFGFAYGELGVGEDVRMAAMACETAGIPYRIVNISTGKEIRQADFELKLKVDQSSTHAPYPVNIFCIPGFDTAARVFLQLGHAVFEDHYNIGWWPWELGTWPNQWNDAFLMIDEVWAGSQFSYEMYLAALGQLSVKTGKAKPCTPMPLAVSIDRLKQSRVKYSKTYFGLSEQTFLFLYVFDFSSQIERKNPKALVNAFTKAFPNSSKANQRVGLVLKIMNVNPANENWQAFEKLCKKDPRITIISKTLDRPDVLGLLASCDAYVSPHRAEGFGRTIAEAMLLGKPVIATNYSGNAFFMNPAVNFPVDYELVQVSPGQYHFVEENSNAVWADPSIDHLAVQMQQATLKARDPEFIQVLLNYANQTFAPQRTGQLMRQRIEQVLTLIK